jgi:hypothetical protein
MPRVHPRHPHSSRYEWVEGGTNMRPASGMSPGRTPACVQQNEEKLPMATSTATRRKVAVTQMHVALTSSSSFDDLVAALKITLTVPELPGFKGCRPCLSGLDRVVIEDLAMRGMR